MKQAICLFLVSFLGIGLLQSAELEYQGKSLGEWINELPDIMVLAEPDSQAVIALKAITKESLPELIQMLQPPPPPVDEENVNCCGLSGDGVQVGDAQITLIVAAEEAKAGLSELKKLLLDPEYTRNASVILPFLGKDGFDVLTSGLRNEEPKVRYYSALNYGWPLQKYFRENLSESYGSEFQASASEGIPILIKLMRDPYKEISVAAMFSLIGFADKPEVIAAFEKVIRDESLKSTRRERAVSILGRRTALSEGSPNDLIWNRTIELFEELKDDKDAVLAEQIQSTLEWMDNWAKVQQEKAAASEGKE